ncbi:SDR family NAD(P)-dependent oxidoreductase [Marinoscillum sp. MHG1-6]|uniref:SDR family NAD(P)-dependent oxidoreductase n=1 Tax=Marinoscillum sp. MHG1-6 TaxID=2959627 RepID=UPI0021578D56|nr:SDR family NAD(P)-dependent oxidoreductase [Marinoscillum sp. MHG1-6]
MSKRIVITGSNRGIGFEIARQLAVLGHEIIFTARNTSKGLEAEKQLADYDVHFFQLDLEEPESIETFVHALGRHADHVDVLINNAAILKDSDYHLRNLPMEVLDRMLQVNLKGPILLTQLLLPYLLKSIDPRIVNLSSGMGALSSMGGGYPAYRISKTALNSFTAILASEQPKIKVNSVCPGWVRTDMGGANASRSVERGAETAVWLATEPAISTGKFFRDKRVIDW